MSSLCRYGWWAVVLPILMSCASPPTGREVLEQRQSQNTPHPAAFAADGFFVNNNGPEKEVKHYEFFFKNCNLVSRKRYPSHSDYECTGPE